MIFVHCPTVQNLKPPQDDANQEATEESRKPWKVESIVDFYVFRTEKNMMISKLESSQVPYKDVTLGILEPFFLTDFPPVVWMLKVCDFHDFTQSHMDVRGVPNV